MNVKLRPSILGSLILLLAVAAGRAEDLFDFEVLQFRAKALAFRAWRRVTRAS